MPSAGLRLPGERQGGTRVRIAPAGGSGGPTRRLRIAPGGVLHLKARWFRPGRVYRVELLGPSGEQVLAWRILGPRASAQVEARLRGLRQSLPDARQRAVMDALVLYQMGLSADLPWLRARWRPAPR